MSFLRKYLQAVPSYVPGEQPLPGSSVIKLNTNENPYPPSPLVMQVLQSLDPEWLRRYPDPTAIALRQVAGEVWEVLPDWITAGNGSDELISLIVRAFVDPGETVVYPMPTYVLYRTVAQMQNTQPVELSYSEGFALPMQDLLDLQGKVTFIAAPNSPTGNVVPMDQLETLATSLQGILVIDEAYVDFTQGNALHLAHKYDNVIILRTLSKSYSLAGLRLGLAIAQPHLIADLNRVKDSYAVDAIAALLGAAALRDQEYKNLNVAKVLRSRTILRDHLVSLGFQVWPSEANFLLVKPPYGDALDLQKNLKQQGILIRHFNLPGVADKLRITVGTDEQNEQLCHLLKAQMHP